MSLKESIREAREKTIEEGGDFWNWLHGIEFGKMLGGLAFLLAIGVGLVYYLPIALQEIQHAIAIKNCKCENIDPDYVSYDYDNKLLISRCDFCERPKTLQGNVVNVVVDVKPGCIFEGFRMEVWTYDELPGFEDYVTYNIPATDHLLGDILIGEVLPTCSEEGKTAAGYCAYCHELIESEPIPKLEHTFVETQYVSSTCTTIGYEKGVYCSECDYVKVAPKVIEMKKHNIKKGTYEATYEHGAFNGEKCEDCGYISKVNSFTSEPGVSEFLDYEIVSNKCIITNIKVSQENFVIPDYINGYLVVELAEGLFADDNVLKNISLPKGLTQIKMIHLMVVLL